MMPNQVRHHFLNNSPWALETVECSLTNKKLQRTEGSSIEIGKEPDKYCNHFPAHKCIAIEDRAVVAFVKEF